MRKKGVALTVLSSVALTSFLAGCENGGTPNSDAVRANTPEISGKTVSENTGGAKAKSNSDVTTITFWHTWSGIEAKAVQTMADEFNKTHPKIHVEVLSNVTPQKELTAMTGGTPPDVAYTYGWADIPKWASVGAIDSLGSYISAAKLNTKDFVPAALKLAEYQGTPYALPYTMDTLMLFYNKTLFKDAGIAGPPQTISQMKADALKLTKKSNGQYSQVGFLPDSVDACASVAVRIWSRFL